MVCGQDALANASCPHTIQCMKCMALQCNAMQCRAMHFMHCMVCGQDALANASCPDTIHQSCSATEPNMLNWCRKQNHSMKWNALHCIALPGTQSIVWCVAKMHWPMHLVHTPYKARLVDCILQPRTRIPKKSILASSKCASVL